MSDILWRFETANFAVTCYASPEDMDPAYSFTDPDDIEAVRSGKWDWFQASVIVTGPNGEELGADYLGGCAYDQAVDFVRDHRRYAPNGRGYFGDMVREAIRNARGNFAKLQRVKLREVA